MTNWWSTNNEVTLVSFAIPRELKKKLDLIAKRKHLTKTSIILFCVERWVYEEAKKLHIDFDDPDAEERDTDLPSIQKVKKDDDPWL